MRDFEASVAEARKYEEALSTWLQRQYGYYVLPTYDYSGLGDSKAPKLYKCESGLVIPDLFACRGGSSLWMECKWKTRADWHRKTQRLATGISKRHFEHYIKVEEVSGVKVYIAFLHVEEDEIRIAPLSKLKDSINHEYDGKKMGRAGMVFWRYDALILKGRLSEIGVHHTNRNEEVASWT
jgi:hypothetical protein